MRIFLLLIVLALAGLGFYGAASWSRESIRVQTQYDAAIRPVAGSLGLDPLLVRAVIWRESRFNPRARGLNKERGLMQVTPAVAAAWAAENRVELPNPDALYDPGTNIAVGCWYLSKILSRWRETDRPEAFALAEYNAGRSNALRWVDPSSPGSAAVFEGNITYGSTRRYVDTILRKYGEYRRGYFRPPWLEWCDRLLRRGDAPTLSPPANGP